MLVHGVWGSKLPAPTDVPLSDEGMEVFGVDWEGLCNENLLQSCAINNPNDEAAGSWLGHNPPPENLNWIDVEPPTGAFPDEEMLIINNSLLPLLGAVGDDEVGVLWTEALVLAHSFCPDLF